MMVASVTRTAAQARHGVVSRLPPPVRERLVARVVPPVNRFTVPLPDGQQMWFAAPAAHRYANRLFWEGAASYEPHTAKTWWTLSRDATGIIDVGAHLGYYTVLAATASPTATVHAFEPLTEAALILRRTVAANRCHNVHVHGLAVGSAPGTAVLSLPLDPPNRIPTVASTADDYHDDDVQQEHRTVAMTTLDAAVPSRVDLLKIDVEGAELDVLRGAERLLERWSPDIVMEVAPARRSTTDALAWLARHTYRKFDLTERGPMPVKGPAETMGNLRGSAVMEYGEVLASTRPDAEIERLQHRVARLRWQARR